MPKMERDCGGIKPTLMITRAEYQKMKKKDEKPAGKKRTAKKKQ